MQHSLNASVSPDRMANRLPARRPTNLTTKKGNRGLRGGRGSDSLSALRPTACAQASGRMEWVLAIRFPSDESLGLDMSALPGLAPRIPTPPTEGGMGHPLQDWFVDWGRRVGHQPGWEATRLS